MNNINIINWLTGKRYIDESEIIEALKDIINGSNDYNYNFSMALKTVKFFGFNINKGENL